MHDFKSRIKIGRYRGDEWSFENLMSRQIFVRSRNLGSLGAEYRNLDFACMYFLHLRLGFLSLSSRARIFKLVPWRVSDFTIRYPYIRMGNVIDPQSDSLSSYCPSFEVLNRNGAHRERVVFMRCKIKRRVEKFNIGLGQH